MMLKRGHMQQLLTKLSLPILAWSLVVVGMAAAILSWDNVALTQQAEMTAEQIFERDLLFRQWNASHGGVYVPISDHTPPNPQLDFLLERDIKTSDGRNLTLMNPAYMTRQVHELGNAQFAIKAHLTSLNPLAPGNVPDPWEERALRSFNQGAERVAEVVSGADGGRLRFMRPFVTQQSCLKCHAQQGYSLGDIRGGLSVSVPLPELFSLDGTWFKLLALASLWLIGTLGMLWWGWRENSLIRRVDMSHQRQQQVESSMRFLENYDRQTHLPNYGHLQEKLREQIDKDVTASQSTGLLIIDFSELPRLQLAFSSSLVPVLLRKAAERISGSLFNSDLVARAGDYRLAILLPKILDRTNLQAVADKLSRELEVPLRYEDEDFQLTPVFGAASFPEDGHDAEEIFSLAVTGLEHGCRDYHHQVGFAPASNQILYRRVQLEKDLRRAISDKELQVYFQPQVDAVHGRVIGAEALVRWEHAERGMVPPSEFIPWLEEAGLMGRMGEHVLREACCQFVRMGELGWKGLRLSLNLSARQFRDPGLVDQIDEALQESGLQAECLELEITEGSFIADFERTVEVLTELKSLGVRVAIDDFGTGFSSLSYLSKLPVDTLKIDRSFVTELEGQGDVVHIVDAIISMADKLHFELVAEGVETASQVERLKTMGCPVMQGFYYAKPLKGQELEEFLALHADSALQPLKRSGEAIA